MRRLRRRFTIPERLWPNTPEFLSIADTIAQDALDSMLTALWKGYDALYLELVVLGDVGDGGDEAERNLTTLLHVRTEAALTGEESFTCRHAFKEMESRLAPPAQAPEYDIAFVLRDNQRIAWPVEAKVIRGVGAIAPYVADINEQFLTCRYAPFSRSGAMVAYMFRGDAQTFFENVENALGVQLSDYAGKSHRQHRISGHLRQVPPNLPYPADFECHHLAMAMPAVD